MLAHKNYSCFRGKLLQIAVILSVMTLSVVSWGHEVKSSSGSAWLDVPEFIPLSVPDRIVLTWTADPARSQAVTWRTNDKIKQGYGEIAEAGEGPLFVEKLRKVKAKTVSFDGDSGKAHYHTVEFTDLRPRTKYAYRVGDGTHFSEWSHFITAGDRSDPFSFVYVGDAQNAIKSHWSRVIRSAFTDAPKAAFMLHAGDLVNRAEHDAEWGEWFYATGFIHRMIPCIATPGNHEYASNEKTGTKNLSKNWRPTFAFPQHGPKGLKESVYFIDYQGLRIVSLNSNERQQEQVSWLKQALAKSKARWHIVTFHHPLYASKEGRDNSELRNLWQPVFDTHRVDLVLQGHDHTYARSGLLTHENIGTGVTLRDQTAGTVYVVSVSGPKMYTLGELPLMTRTAEDTQLYQIIHINHDKLRYEAKTATGRLYDGFTLVKRNGKTNQLIEQVPPRPERRRINGERVP